MCGLCGFLEEGPLATRDELMATVHGMSAVLSHRGPDDGGTWVDEAAGIALGHRRLAVIDLSHCGAQPMVSRAGRYVMVFNGEIYNYIDLRDRLRRRGVEFRGESDTEVLLQHVEALGLHMTLQAADGMFAFGLWDRKQRVLTLARDKFGEKPLYYGRVGTSFLFASELKAIAAVPGAGLAVDPNALTAFMRLSYVPSPMSIYKGIRKLPPGSFLQYRTGRRSDLPAPQAYWRPPSSRVPVGSVSEQDALPALDALLKSAVRSRMVADVPVGAFLSGGIDSSLIAALMQETSRGRVSTFSIGFEDEDYNEAAHAQAVARHLGTDHHELRVTPQDAQAVIPLLPQMYDEPFADSSQIPTYLVSKLAREHVTVSLSGDAADELFGGYDRYRIQARVWRMLDRVPERARGNLSAALLRVKPDTYRRAEAVLNSALPGTRRLRRSGERAHKLATLLRSASAAESYRMLMSHWDKPGALVPSGVEMPSVLTDARLWPEHLSRLGQPMFVDCVTYLPDDILVKVDRAAMAVSLETRVPFLDPVVVEFAAMLPDDMRLRAGVNKWLVRQLLYQYVPQALVDRPKMGFGVPIGSWLRGPLRTWAEDLLSVSSLENNGFLDVTLVRASWEQHVSGARDLKYPLWNVLMFLQWAQEHGQHS